MNRFSVGGRGLLPFTALLGLALALLAGCRKPLVPDDGVELLLGTVELQPDTSLELRLPSAVVSPEALGRPVTNAPIRIDPHVPGDFIWVSRRSGIFTPREPLQLGTTYRVWLEDGLKDARGQALPTRLLREIETPAFGVQDLGVGYWDTNDIPALPTIQVALNAAVEPAEFVRRAEFRRAGVRIAARLVEPPPDKEVVVASGWNPVNGTSGTRTWRERFGMGRLKGRAAEQGVPDPETRTPIRGEFQIAPAQALTPGAGWEFVIDSGLRSPESPKPMRTPFVRPLGTVRPFEVVHTEAVNSLGDGRVIRVHFNKQLAPVEKLEELSRWVKVQPPVEGLEFHTAWSTLAVHAKYELGTNYVLQIDPGLASMGGVALLKAFKTNLAFAPIEPHVWFPAFETTQLARGSRVFPIRGVNVGRFRLKAKRLDEHNLVHALRGYGRYFGRTGLAAAVDFEGLAGRTVFDQELAMSAAVDEEADMKLEWDDVLGRGRAGALFLTAELSNPTNAPWSPLAWSTGPQSLVQISDLGLAWKSSPDGIQAWSFSHADGRGLGGVKVRLVGRENEFLSETMTDGQGLARLEHSTNAVWLMASREEDLHAVQVSENQVPLWSFGFPWHADFSGGDGAQTETKVFFFTDRTLYRPGEPIHAKGIVRTWKADRWEIPEGASATLRLTDPRGDIQLSTNLAVSANGSIQVSFDAPARPRGSYTISVLVGAQQAVETVRVADFQSATFEVGVGARPVYGPEESIRIPVTAKYLQGEPVRGARVHWHFEGHPAGFKPEGWDAFQFCLIDGSLQQFGLTPTSVSDDGTERPAPGTNLVVALDFKGAGGPAPQPFNGTLVAEVSDLNDLTVTKTAEFVRHSSDFYLGFRWRDGEEALLAPNVPLPFELRAVAADGTPFNGPISARARLRRMEWNTVRTLSAGGAVDYRSEAELKDVEEFAVSLTPSKEPVAGLSTDEARIRSASGVSGQFASVHEPGQYLVDIRATDAAGREVVTAVQFNVGGDAHLAWNYRNGAQLDLVPDRKTYAGGDTAVVLAKAPFGGTAWVTVERENVRRSFVTELTGNAPLLRIPIEAGDAPNVFVSVILVRGTATSPREHPTPEWRVGYCELKVANPADHLGVAVTIGAPEVRPGADVDARVLVTAPGGSKGVAGAAPAPVADAEVTLYAVDEGVLTLSGDAVPDPRTFFGESRPLGIQTGMSLRQLFPENPELHEFSNKGAMVGGGGDLGSRWREDFRPCAVWLAELKTGPDGSVAARFKAPDSLTRFRVVAVATSGATRFGSGSTTFAVNKPLMLQPSVVSFAHAGDAIRARAMVFNRGTNALESLVTLELDGAAEPAGAPRAAATNSEAGESPSRLQRALTIAPGAAAPVDFEVRFVGTGTSTWRWAVSPVGMTGDGLVDRVVSKTMVNEPVAAERQVFTFRTDAAETNLVPLLDPRLLEGDGRLTVRLSNSRLGELGECISQLLHYPYGCVEQTSSSLLPWLLFSDARGLIPGLDPDSPRFNAAIRDGVGRLLGMQTLSGGLGYWPGAKEPLFWGSAYAALVLGIAREHGVEIPDAPYDRLLDYLSKQLRGTEGSSQADRESMCLALYALAKAGKAEPSWYDVLRRDRDKLGNDDAAFVALSMLHTGNVPTDIRDWLQLKPSTNRVRTWFGGDARTAAVSLLAWARYEPEGPETKRRLEALLKLRQAGNWGTTQGNAWALYALSGLASAGSDGGARQGEVSFGSDRWEFQIGAKPGSLSHDFILPRGAGTVPIRLRNPAGQSLVVQGTLLSRPPGDPSMAAAVRRGFNLERRLERLDDQNRPGPLGDLRVGDRVLVTLRLACEEDAEWVAIEDPLPAVFEVVKPHFEGEPGSKNGLRPWSGDFQEVRGDSMRFFRNNLPADLYEIRYVVRVRAAGTVVAPGARIEAMYQPQRFGQSAAARIVTRPYE